jgi:AcrR family transcriptional regulator
MSSKTCNDFKKQIILDAARKVLTRYGYDGTTISLIATNAGVSRGLLHYYFKSKDEILSQVIKNYTKSGTTEINEFFSQNLTPEDYAAGITAWFKDIIINDSYLFLSIYEGVTLSRHSRVLNSEIADSYIQWKQAMEIGLKQAQEKQNITPKIPVKELAALISALIDGMGLQFLADPEMVNDDLIMESLKICIADLLGGR